MSPSAALYLDKCRDALTSTEEQLDRLQKEWEDKKDDLDDYEIGPVFDKVTTLCADIKATIEKLTSYQTSQ
ncbi:MAG: hypothetical protein QM703_13780 [Gemmatales bacterium]